MKIFGRRLGEYARFVRVGMIVILLVGIARFVVGISGVPYERATHLVSVTILTMVLAVFYGQRAAATRFGGYRHLLPIGAALAATMYGFIIAAILVEGLGGIHGYFHAPGQGIQPGGMSVGVHVTSQLIAMVVATGSFWLLASVGYFLSRHIGFARHALLILLAVAVARVALGAAGVPYAIGTWVTSLTLAAMALALYLGYRAPAGGLQKWTDVVLLGIVIATALDALIVYGIVVTTALEIPSYFHDPGKGFQPDGLTVAEHIRGHLQFSIVGTAVLIFLSGIGFAVGRRKRPAAATAAGA